MNRHTIRLMALIAGLTLAACGSQTDDPKDDATADSGAATDTGSAATDSGTGAVDSGAGGTDSGGGTADTSDDTGGADAGDTGGAKDTAVGPKKDECNGIDDDKDGQTDEDACDDDDLCTEDICDGPKKQCTWKKIGEGEACDDGNACTQKETCQGGKCVAGEATKCDDGDPCTADQCNAAIGICEHPAMADGGSCDDGDPCTDKDTCQGGKCVAAGSLVCDDKNPCTQDACMPSVGCTVTNDDGKACDDGDICTKNDACKGGKCSGDLPQDCAANDPCEVASCDPKTGACKKTVKKDGETCDDGDACTTGELCTGGKCGGGKGTSCPPGSACAPNTCDPKTGQCGVTQLKDGDKCDDGNPCTTKETCQAGKCIDIGQQCNDDNACTKDSCDPTKGCQNEPITGACEDGNVCTEGETCKDGKCQGAKPKDCDDGTTCTVDACDKKTGQCSHDAKPQEGKPCNDDGSVCTAGESCKAGKCQGGTPKTCSDGKPCTADVCDPKTGACTFPPAKPGAACDDGSFCTFSDACDDKGKCTGKSFPCDDKNPCTTDSCIAQTGKCNFVPKKAGDACDDGDLCTSGDACDKAGKCAAGKAKNCNDGNACTNDSCTASTGKCLNSPNNASCNDGSVCTIGDACISGKCQSGADGSASVWAGNGSSGLTNGAWNVARFGEPRGITSDGKGGYYVADRTYHRIRYISPSRQVSTAAGSGSYGYKEGSATSAYFRYPAGVGYDKAGATLYIADTYNHCIRKLSGGQVSHVAGKCGTSSSYYGYAEGSGTNARFYYPEDIAAADDGTVYVADRANHVIRTISGGSTSLLAGGPKSSGYQDGKGNAARFSNPYGIDVSPSGIVFVADSSNYRIRAIQPDGTVTTIAGQSSGFADGYKTAARFAYPYDVTWAKGNILYVADANNHRIRKVTLGGLVTTFSGSGTASFLDGPGKTARFYYPRSLVATASGDVMVSDTSNRRIRKVTIGVLQCGDDNPCTLDKCDAKKGCTNDKISAGSKCDDGALCTVGGTCDAAGQCSGGKPKCTDGGPCVTTTCDTLSGDCVFKADGTKCDDGDVCTEGEACILGKCDATTYKVETVSGTGSNSSTDGTGTGASHAYPRGMGHDSTGNVFVADYNGHRIRRITATKSVTTVAGSGSAGFQDGSAKTARFYYPCDVAWATDGSLFVADRQNHRIRKIDGSGNVTTYAGSGSAGFQDGASNTARFYYPESVDVELSTGVVYVADSYNNRIRKITPNGTVSVFVGSGSSSYKEGTGTSAYVYRPTGVAVGPGGVVYFSSYYHHMIRRATPQGTTSLLAGTTSAGFADGSGSSARFYYPADIAVDKDGNVLVADRSNRRIRRITPTGIATTLAGSGSSGFQDGKATTARFNNPYGVTAFGEKVYVGDSSNYRIRAIKPPKKDCDDGNPCTTDSCDAKTGACKNVDIANCCAPVPYYEDYSKTTAISKMKFYSCTPDKFNVALKGCKEVSGSAPKQGWQLATDAFAARSAPGALYYGDGVAGNYNWGASAGKVITEAIELYAGKKSKLSFWVYFDTEAPTAFDKFYCWLHVDGKRVNLGDTKAPNLGAAWYKGKPGYTATKTWHKVEIDVSAYAGKKVALEFTFNTGDGLKNFGVGAAVDDIQVTTACQ